MTKRTYRKHIRLKNYDYSKPGCYFVTVCTKKRKSFFELRVPERYEYVMESVAATHASPLQKKNTDIAKKCLLQISEHYPSWKVVFYIFVPNHIHFILAKGGACPAATDVGDKSVLGNVVGSFKAAVSKRVGISLWQPNYYEHVIRNERSLDNIRHYILEHPYREFDRIDWDIFEDNL